MSTSADKELVRRFVGEVFEARRPEAVDALVADDFRSHTWGPSGSGKAELRAATVRMAELLSEVHFEIDDLIAEGDRVAVRLTASATPVGAFMGVQPSGKGYSIGEIHIFRVAAGRIVEHWHQYDKLGLMKQLGIRPPGADA